MPKTHQNKKRKLKNNRVSFEWPNKEIPELNIAVQLSVITKAPEKYILIDMETGQVFVGSNHNNPYDPNYKTWIEQKL
jgi:hypothetical protein